jgi:CRISPR/Cas system-associated endonuclease Cas3-HD
MHAIRDYSDLVEAPGLQWSQIPPGLVVTLKESQVRAEDVEVLVMDLREFDVLDLDAFRDVLARDITEKDVRDLLGMVSDLERSKSFTRLYVTLLLPVVVGDNIDARNTRRSDKEYNWRKLFAEELARLVGGVRCE